MKILLVSQRAEAVRKFFIGTEQVIVAELPSMDLLLFTLVKTAPQVVFLDRPIVPAGILDRLSRRFPATRFARIDFGRRHWERQFLFVLGHGKGCPPHPPVPEQRHIVFDPGYFPYFTEEKPDDTSRILDEEADRRRLADLVNATRDRRASFAWRWEGWRAYEKFEAEEIIRHLVQGSAKAAAYAREQAGRCLALLAHSVPATETICLPYPCDPAPAYRYVHYRTSPETCYAVASVAGFGCDPCLVEQLMVMLGWRFTGDNPAELTRATVPMLGLLLALRQIAESHQVVMTWLLDEQLPEPFTQADRRHLQIFRDFWCFGHGLETPVLLQRYIDSADTYRRHLPLTPMVSFAEFAKQTGLYTEGKTL